MAKKATKKKPKPITVEDVKNCETLTALETLAGRALRGVQRSYAGDIYELGVEEDDVISFVEQVLDHRWCYTDPHSRSRLTQARRFVRMAKAARKKFDEERAEALAAYDAARVVADAVLKRGVALVKIAEKVAAKETARLNAERVKQLKPRA